ncbi:MAG: hypothetical protein ACW99G_02685 [Candidatus Thorarchaeota archaeon]|jgi:phosphoribosylanthranilate isomerase
MKKILNRVTITGADNRTNIQDMVELSKKYPWIEWGILLSESSMGRARFPCLEWIKELYDKRDLFEDNPFSGHLCGKWVRQVCKGDWSFVDALVPCNELFKRYQLNFHAIVHKIKDKAAFIEGFRSVHPWTNEFVFQLDNVNNEIVDVVRAGNIDAQPFFDLSGGVGVLPEKWDKAQEGVYTGYAGGLSPENVHDQLIEIEKVCGEGPIWIDTETRVRTDDDQSLDMDKVESFVKASEPWMLEDFRMSREV